MKYNYEKEQKKEKRKKIFSLISGWTIMIAIAILLAFLIVHFFVSREPMIDNAMNDSIASNQDVVVFNAAYKFFSPSRYHVIAFTRTTDVALMDKPLLMVRRVIGLPGEKIQIKDGFVYINGEKLEEKYNMTPMNSGGLAEAEITLGDDEYFVLGDNRNDCEDSRFRSFGNVKRDNIYGRVCFKLDSFGLIGGPTEKKEDE